MKRTRPTIRSEIERHALSTNASKEFIEAVQRLFDTKGIPLDAEATPYREALEEAFARDSMVRENVAKARDAAEQLQRELEQLSEKCRAQLEELERIRDTFQDCLPMLGAFSHRLQALRYYLAEFFVK